MSKTLPPIAKAHLVGRPRSAAAATVLAAGLTFEVGRRVAEANAYLPIERSLPTYAGTPTALFFAAGAALVTLAALSAYLDAGAVPAVLLASGPVVGWAVNHWSAPVTPHYAPTFPLEMAVLYGGAFGILGYLVGTGFRTAVPPTRLRPSTD